MVLTASLLWLTMAAYSPNFGEYKLATGGAEPAKLAGLGRPDVKPDQGLTLQDDDAQVFPEIVSGKIVWYKGKKFMCGRAKQSGWEKNGFMRYVIALEIDWQIWEPPMDADTWEPWDGIYDDICKGVDL